MRVSPINSTGMIIGTPVIVNNLREPFFLPIDRGALFTAIRVGDWVATREGVRERPRAVIELAAQLFASEGTITITTTWTMT